MPRGSPGALVTVAPRAIRWFAVDAPRDRAALAAALGVGLPVEDRIEVAGLRLEIMERGLRPGEARPRLEVADDDPGSRTSRAVAGPVATAGSFRSASPTARFLALGWATVELERPAASRPAVLWEAAPRDAVVGARALVGRAGITADMPPAGPAPATGTPPGADVGHAAAARAFPAPVDVVPIVLLEPDTEGCLEAALARHGEGPAVLYLRVPAVTTSRMPARLARLGIRARAGTGPFGPEWAILGSQARSPTLVMVPDAGPAEHADPAQSGRPGLGRRGTIGP